jgi:hypothetical protein
VPQMGIDPVSDKLMALGACLHDHVREMFPCRVHGNDTTCLATD